MTRCFFIFLFFHNEKKFQSKRIFEVGE